MNKVYIVQCKDYAEADDKIQALIDLMGGMVRFAKQGEKIVLKVNLLREARPEAAVCTHPSVAAAVGKLVRQEGANAVIADSPGGGMKKIWTKFTAPAACTRPRLKPVLNSTGTPPPGRHPTPRVF